MSLLLILNHHHNHFISRGWILSGGLRRKQPHGSFATVIPAIIIVEQPPREPEPPIVDIAVEQVWNDDDESTD